MLQECITIYAFPNVSGPPNRAQHREKNRCPRSKTALSPPNQEKCIGTKAFLNSASCLEVASPGRHVVPEDPFNPGPHFLFVGPKLFSASRIYLLKRRNVVILQETGHTLVSVGAEG